MMYMQGKRKSKSEVHQIRCFPESMEACKALYDDKGSRYDSNAIRIVVHILSLSRRNVIGYIPWKIAKEFKDIIDMGIQVKATLVNIIGGYSYKESLGALIDITV